jgi:ATP-dependent DNA helicase RecQ
MQVLTEALDDPSSGPCGRCSVCTGSLPPPGAGPSEETMLAARRHLRGRRHELEPRKLWPAGGGRKGRIVGLAPGRAVAFADDPAWSELIAELGGPDGPPSDELRGALVDVLSRWAREWDSRPLAVVPVPSRSRPRRVRGMAEHVAEIGRLPLVEALTATGPAPAAEVSSGVRVRQLAEGLRLDPGAELPAGPVLLVDDVARSTWTVTVAAALLRDAGAGPVLPLVGHRRP